jgi:hypothetical protein
MESISVTDLYQASFLLLEGCELTGIECFPMTGSIACRMTFSGPKLPTLMDTWFEKSASANLWAFRTAYNQVNSYVHQAKKNFDRTRRGAERGAAGGASW